MISSFLSLIDVNDKEIMICNFLYMLTLNLCRHRIKKTKLHETITNRKSVKNRSYHYISISSRPVLQYQIEHTTTNNEHKYSVIMKTLFWGVSKRHGPTHKWKYTYTDESLYSSKQLYIGSIISIYGVSAYSLQFMTGRVCWCSAFAKLFHQNLKCSTK